MNKAGMILVISTIGLTALGVAAAVYGKGSGRSNPAAIVIRPDPAPQGAVVSVSITVEADPAEALCLFKGKKIRIDPSQDPGIHRCLIGIDMKEKPGRYDIAVELTSADGTRSVLRRPLKVVEGRFGEERFTIAGEMDTFDDATLARIRREKVCLDAIWNTIDTEILWSPPFIEPVRGEKGSLFGTKRWINDAPRSPHTGIDVKATTGTPVAAVNRGQVVFTGEQFFSGKSVVLDHGGGIYSMYFHLSEILVTEASVVERGMPVGLVGSTGRSTGPHLHWGIRMQGARVDPLSLVECSEGLHGSNGTKDRP